MENNRCENAKTSCEKGKNTYEFDENTCEKEKTSCEMGENTCEMGENTCEIDENCCERRYTAWITRKQSRKVPELYVRGNKTPQCGVLCQQKTE